MSDQRIPSNNNSAENFISSAPSGDSHSFDIGFAIAYGQEEAVMIKNFQHFIKINRARGDHFHEGRWWTYDRHSDFVKHFPYWTKKQVRRILNSLIKKGVIIVGKFNEHWSDQTQWYAFRDEQHFLGDKNSPKQPESKKSYEVPKRALGKCPNGHLADAHLGTCIYKESTTISTAITTTKPHTPLPEDPKPDKKSAIASVDVLVSSEIRDLAKKVTEVLASHNEMYKPAPIEPIAMQLALLMQDGKATAKHVLAVINWSANHHYWKSILYKRRNLSSFCEKFVSMYAQMTTKPPETNKVDRRTLLQDGTPVEVKELF